jgi:sugar phosphate isomerase/epimerase
MKSLCKAVVTLTLSLALPMAALAAPHIAHCHVHDNYGGSVYHSEKNLSHQIPFGRGDSHMPVGWGSVPFAEIFAEFVAGYDGLLICELRGRYFDHTGEAARNLAGILKPLGVAISPGQQN